VHAQIILIIELCCLYKQYFLCKVCASLEMKPQRSLSKLKTLKMYCMHWQINGLIHSFFFEENMWGSAPPAPRTHTQSNVVRGVNGLLGLSPLGLISRLLRG